MKDKYDIHMHINFKRRLFIITVITCINVFAIIIVYIKINKFSCGDENNELKEFYPTEPPNDQIADLNDQINKIFSLKIEHEQQICRNNKKYLRFECHRPNKCGGWADRLKGIMSAYLWALITNREFLIDVQHPCQLTNMLQPNEVPWDAKIQCNKKKFGSQNIKKPYFHVVRMNTVSNTDFLDIIRQLDIENYYRNASLLIIRNNLDWTDSFSSNEKLSQKIKEIGYDPAHFKLSYMFRALYQKLFKLSYQLQLKYNEFLEIAKPNNSTKLICAQVRIGGKRPNVPFDRQFTEPNNSKLFWQFIKKKFLNNIKDTNYKIFVTTDTENVEKEAIEEFGSDIIVTNPGPFTHMDRELIITPSNCNRVDKAVLDFHALQNCDMAVISQSGFGIYGVLNRQEPLKDLYIFESVPNPNIYLKEYAFRQILDLDYF